jgi:hypothetical protein
MHKKKRTLELRPGELVTLPPIEIIIAGGENDIVIKISDRGGGFKRGIMPQLWTHFYSTEDGDSILANNANLGNSMESSPKLEDVDGQWPTSIDMANDTPSLDSDHLGAILEDIEARPEPRMEPWRAPHQSNLADETSPLLGVGAARKGLRGASIPNSLPMSRLYARFFGGDIKAFPMEGHGTDIYVYLSKDGDFNNPFKHSENFSTWG